MQIASESTEMRYSSVELRAKDAGTSSYEMHKKNSMHQYQVHLKDIHYNMKLQFTIATEISKLKKRQIPMKGSDPLSVFQDQPSSVPLPVERRLGQSSKSAVKLA